MPVVERPSPDEALARVTTAVGDRVTEARLNFGQVDITCPPSAFVEVVRSLRDTDGLRFEFFTFLSGVDRTEFGGEAKDEKAGGLEVLCHLYSPAHGIHVNVHVPVDLNEPVCPSLTSLFAGASWHERETYEMFGVHFEGHPHLVRLYLPEDFEGNPLRKSFKLPGRHIKPWPGAKDPEEAAAGGR